MGRPTIIALTAILLGLLAQPAWAAKRVALVIGNSGYQSVAQLTNPANDAAAMSAVLKEAGFDIVESRRDLTIPEMRRVLRRQVARCGYGCDLLRRSRHRGRRY